MQNIGGTDWVRVHREDDDEECFGRGERGP
jgi:hypothetical protein